MAIANASSYGHDVTRNVREADGGTTTTVRVSLLRVPKFPDPGADQGRHELHVTIRPGASNRGRRRGGLPHQPGTADGARGAHGVEPLFTVSNPALVIEAVKLAEDGSGDVVVRLYESLGERSVGVVRPISRHSRVQAVDLLERPVRGARGDDGARGYRRGSRSGRSSWSRSGSGADAPEPMAPLKQAEWERSSRTATTHPPMALGRLPRLRTAQSRTRKRLSLSHIHDSLTV